MRIVTIRLKAAADLDDIYRYGLETWGQMRASSYLQGVDGLFRLLAEQPDNRT